MSLQERSATERIPGSRARYVARGVSIPALVVDRVAGARVWDVEVKECLDFAGRIGCVNLGHCEPTIVAATPLTIADAELERGLAILEEAVAGSAA
jgi:4-aminobutyrate aminotransferase-like enzyme